MFLRARAQSITRPKVNIDELLNAEECEKEISPKIHAAILDGLALQNHIDIKNHIVIDDPDTLESKYSVEQREHGTLVSSIIINGNYQSESRINSKVYLSPVLGPDALMVEDKLILRSIYEAVQRIFSTEETKNVRIINLSIGDSVRKFHTRMSSLSKLVDWLSFKYKVLFLISAGNSQSVNLDLPISPEEFSKLDKHSKQKEILKAKRSSLNDWKILSPAESINCVSIGASEYDDSNYSPECSNNSAGILYKEKKYHAVYGCLGLGLKNSIKPELLMPSGAAAYRLDYIGSKNSRLKMVEEQPHCGLLAALPYENHLDKRQYCAIGTSFGTALATNQAIRIYEYLLDKDYIGSDPDYDALFIKNLLIHSTYHEDGFKKLIKDLPSEPSVGNPRNVARFLGFGMPDFAKATNSFDHSVLILAKDRIKLDQEHKYKIPVPKILSGKKASHRLIITLAWFSPVSAESLNYKVAKLGLNVPRQQNLTKKSSQKTITKAERKDVSVLGLKDQQLSDKVMGNTIIHLVLEGSQTITPFEDGLETEVSVYYAPNDCGNLEQRKESVPYTLAVTLEIDEDIDIYTEIKTKIEQRVTTEQAIEVRT